MAVAPPGEEGRKGQRAAQRRKEGGSQGPLNPRRRGEGNRWNARKRGLFPVS